ncbi:MAG: type II secretion system protein [Pirellulales bacterium]|nr:type II secretion system protein [Pirellulales bacterium]
MKPASRRAFTLLEVLAIAAILTLLAGILIHAIGRVMDAPRATAVLHRARTYAALIREIVNQPSFGGRLPLTRSGNGGAVPATGLLAAASDTVRDIACSFDLILTGQRIIERFEEVEYGGIQRPILGIQWNSAARAFAAAPDTAATIAAIPAAMTWQRIESRLSDPSLSPEIAQGANFQTLPGLNLPPQCVVVYWRFPRATQSFAEELAKAANKPEHRPAAGAPATVGPVAYATPVGGRTDVFVYLLHH